MNVLIVNYTGYRSNWGCQATSRGLLQWTKTLLSKSPDLGIDIVPYPPTHWRDHWQQMRHGQHLESMFQSGTDIELQDLKFLEQLCLSRFGDLMDRVRKADLIFFQGEGALGPARTFRRTQLFGLPVLAKLLYGKKVVSINQTISYSSNHHANILKSIYASFDMNFVRETESLDLCHSDDWPEFNFLPDAAFQYQPLAPLGNPGIDCSYFCVSGTADLKSYNIKSYAKNIQSISRRWNLKPVFVYSRSNDKAVADEYRKLDDGELMTVSSKSHPDVDQLLEILTGAVMVIGGRYHTSVSALSQNVPVILTRSNSHKSVGLSKLFNGDACLVSHSDSNEMMAAAEMIMTEMDSLKHRLQSSLQSLIKDSNHVSERLAKELNLGGSQSLNGCTRWPEMRLENPWSRLAALKPFLRSVNLGVYDRFRFTDDLG